MDRKGSNAAVTYAIYHLSANRGYSQVTLVWAPRLPYEYYFNQRATKIKVLKRELQTWITIETNCLFELHVDYQKNLRSKLQKNLIPQNTAAEESTTGRNSFRTLLLYYISLYL
jgi:hypothetical protein